MALHKHSYYTLIIISSVSATCHLLAALMHTIAWTLCLFFNNTFTPNHNSVNRMLEHNLAALLCSQHKQRSAYTSHVRASMRRLLHASVTACVAQGAQACCSAQWPALCTRRHALSGCGHSPSPSGSVGLCSSGVLSGHGSHGNQGWKAL